MSLIELACHDASCAPPPTGTGGSSKSGGGGKTFPLQPSPKNSLARGSVKWKGSAEQGREHSQKLLTQDEVYADDDASMWQASAAVMDAVSNAPTVSEPMYRGMALVSDSDLAVQLRGAKVGESLDLGLSGFSLKQGLAMSFARAGGPNNFHVLVELEGGAKAFDVDQAADKAGMNEEERIAAGSFEVLSVHEGKTYTYETNDGTKSYVGPVEIVLRQTEPLKIPEGLNSWADKLYIKQSDVDAAEEERKMIESWSTTTASALIELACHSKACAPPPIGTGGSSDGGGEPKGAGAYSFDELRSTYRSWKEDPKYIRDASFSILMGEENGEIGQPRRSSNRDYTQAAITLDMIANAPTSSVQLFRGLAADPEGSLGREISSLEIGEEVNWPPSGFSTDEAVAEFYYQSADDIDLENEGVRALIVLEPGAKAWSIDDEHDWNNSSSYNAYNTEEEHIVAGGFVVVDIEEREDGLGPYKVITIEQSEPLEMPWSEDGEAKSWMDIVPPDARVVLGSSSLIELACYDASCAPPPVGSGGSSKSVGSMVGDNTLTNPKEWGTGGTKYLVEGPILDHFYKKLESMKEQVFPEGSTTGAKVTLVKSSSEINHQLYIMTADVPNPWFPESPFSGQDVARISWDPKTGIIEAIQTNEPFQRQGLATDVFDAATILAKQFDLVPPAHSENMTTDGEAWAAAEKARGQSNSTTASALIELACYDASCAPPPVGTGGSSDGGGQLSPLKIKTRKPKLLKKAVQKWKGEAVQTREQSVRLIKEEKVDVVTSPVEWANAATLMDAVSEAPMVNKFLYRGISLDPSTELAVQLSAAKAGDTFDWGLSGFSTYEVFATNFTQQGGPDNLRVEFIIQGGAKALDIDAMHRGPYAWEEEHLVAGTFEVLAVAVPPENFAHEPTIIVISQTEPLKIPDGMESWADKLYVQEANAADAELQLKSAFKRSAATSLPIAASADNVFSGLERYGFACYDASCAPPPVGTGGSSKSGTGPAKGGYMDGFKPFSTVDDDGEPLSDELLIDELAVEVGERVAEGKPIWDPKTVAVDSVGIALANTERTILRGRIDLAAMELLSGDALAEYISIEPGFADAYRAYLETGEYPEGTEFLMGTINRDPIAAETFFTYAENSARTAGVYDERMNTAEGKQITQELQAQYAAVLENPRISKLLDRLGVPVPFVEVSHFPLLQGPNQEMHRTFGGQWVPLDAPEPIASYINGMITLRSIAGEQVGGSELSGYEQPISMSLPGDFRTGRDLVGIPGDNGSTVTHELGHFIHQVVRGGRDAVENNPAVVPNPTGVLWNNAWSKYHDEMNADTITSRAGMEAGSSGFRIHERVVQPRQVSDYSHQNQYEGFAETFNAVISGADTSGLSPSGQEMVATMEAIIDGGPALDRMLAAQESGAGT